MINCDPYLAGEVNDWLLSLPGRWDDWLIVVPTWQLRWMIDCVPCLAGEVNGWGGSGEPKATLSWVDVEAGEWLIVYLYLAGEVNGGDEVNDWLSSLPDRWGEWMRWGWWAWGCAPQSWCGGWWTRPPRSRCDAGSASRDTRTGGSSPPLQSQREHKIRSIFMMNSKSTQTSWCGGRSLLCKGLSDMVKKGRYASEVPSLLSTLSLLYSYYCEVSGHRKHGFIRITVSWIFSWIHKESF